MFKIVKLESAVCENPICNQRIDKTTDEYGLSLIVGDTVYNQSNRVAWYGRNYFLFISYYSFVALGTQSKFDL